MLIRAATAGPSQIEDGESPGASAMYLLTYHSSKVVVQFLAESRPFFMHDCCARRENALSTLCIHSTSSSSTLSAWLAWLGTKPSQPCARVIPKGRRGPRGRPSAYYVPGHSACRIGTGVPAALSGFGMSSALWATLGFETSGVYYSASVRNPPINGTVDAILLLPVIPLRRGARFARAT